MGSDRAPQGANNYNTTELVKRSDDASRSGTSDTGDTDDKKSSFLSKLLTHLNNFGEGRIALPITGDQQSDLHCLRGELKAEIQYQFKDSLNYEWESGFAKPTQGDGLGFEPFDDFCSLFQNDPETQISEYFEKNLEFMGVPLPLLAALEHDLLELFASNLRGKPWDGWTKGKFSKSYHDTTRSRPIWKRVDLVFLYILVEAVDLSGKTSPALLIRYIGGLYRLHRDYVAQSTEG